MISATLVTVCLLAGVALLRALSYLRMRIASSTMNNIPGPPAGSFWTGHMSNLFDRHGMEFHQSLATSYGPIVKLKGFLGKPILVVADPKALHYMLIKEEHIYQETTDVIVNNGVFFGPGLVSSLGKQHAKQRKLLNPAFSINHMRHMLPLFFSIARKLRAAIETRVQDGPRDVDVMDWMGRTSLELVGQGGLGHSFDPLVEDSKDAYGQALKRFSPVASSLSLFRGVLPLALKLLPRWVCRAIMSSFPEGTRVKALRDVVDTMDKGARAIYTAKKLAFEKVNTEVAQQNGSEKDIISILMRANSAAKEGERMSEAEIVGQMSTLIFGAMDTTSTTLSRILHLLAQHPDAQMKLRQEVLDAHAVDGLSYEDLNRLPYLDSVLRETLRMHPPIITLFREATQDTIPIPKGTELLLGMLGCNLNQTMWGEDALEWKPERWVTGIPTAVTDAHLPGVYSGLMSFSGGKRACIGFKFSEMEMKVVLCVLVSRFTFELSEQPVVWNTGALAFPTVGKDSTEPALPLKLGLYNAGQEHIA